MPRTVTKPVFSLLSATLVLLAVVVAFALPASAHASFGFVGGLNLYGQGSSDTLAQFTSPYGFARNADGEFFVADTGRNKIIKLSATGQFILEFGFAGNGDGQFNGPMGVAVSPLNGDVWVSDANNHRLQRFDQSGGFLGKVGGPSSGSGNGQFNTPGGVTVKSDGTVFATDIYNHRVQYFDASGTYLGQFGSSGSGDGQFNRPIGISLAESGNVYVTDRLNNRVQYFAPGTPYTFAGKFGCNCSNPDGMVAPQGVFVDQSSTPDVVYVTNDWNDHVVMRFSLAGTLLNKWGPEGVPNPGSAAGVLSAPTGVIADSSGNAWVLESGNSRVQLFSDVASTPTSTGSFGTPGNGAGQFKEPLGVAAASDGSVYVTDTGNKRIQHLSAKNELLHEWGTTGSGPGEIEQLGGVAVAPNGDVYVLNYSNDAYDADSARVMKFSSTGTFITEYTGMGGLAFSYARDLDIDGDGNVYVSDGGNYRVVKFAADGTFITQWGQVGTDSGEGDFQYNDGIAVNAAGTAVYVVDQSSNRVQKFDGSGTSLAESGPHTYVGSTTPGSFYQPTDIDIDPLSGDVYIVDRNNNRLQRFTSGLSYISVFGQKGRDWAQFQYPEYLAFDNGGYLWVADSANDRVQRFGDAPVVSIQTPTDGLVTTDSSIVPTYTTSDAGSDCVIEPAAPYADGVHDIDVNCMNLRGIGTDTVSVTVDTTAPSITIAGPVNQTSTQDGSVVLSYSVSDALDTAPDCTIASGATVPLTIGTNTISVTCTDEAGNGATATTTVTRTAAPSAAEPEFILNLKKKIKPSSRVRFSVVCPAECKIETSVKIGRKTTRFRTTTLAGSTANKTITIKIKKSLLTKIKRAAGTKKPATFSVKLVPLTYKAKQGKTGKASMSK